MIRCIGLILLVINVVPLARGQDAPPVETPRYLVHVSIAGEEARTRCGVVIKGGRVVTTMGSLEGAETVQITTPGGVVYEATGVVSYNPAGNLALLAVDWRRTPAPEAVLASEVKASADDIVALGPIPGKDKPPTRITTKV